MEHGCPGKSRTLPHSEAPKDKYVKPKHHPHTSDLRTGLGAPLSHEGQPRRVSAPRGREGEDPAGWTGRKKLAERGLLPEHHSHPSGLPLCQAAGELTAGVSPQALGEQLSVQGRWWPAPQAAGSRASIMGPLGQALLVILGPE